ncbi:Serine/threonine-protein kinase WNK No protein [Perilla frutescens var. hirtella]|uniref:Serine/threonine-protein kinase WNK No protein n=1 Tax=Perilla frutescens var. hirtella TaxID=608512 RepID=A0AAD4IVK1_PERFH|nr:Serine/threonine-protein kinase WNK No protein [Perilla frutescens var. hirtella]
MEEHLMNPLAATHLLQHTLRSFCIHQNSQWVYAIFWRILPRIFPPPKWDGQVGVHDRSRGNRRNWILAWEDGFCNFTASTAVMNSGESINVNSDDRRYQGLKPEVFFKMSHEIHNYGEGLIGNVAADHSHKWIYKDHNARENKSSAWHNLLNSHPRTWEAQFESGLQTIALIAVAEGVLQLGAVHKISEEASYVLAVRKKFSYIETIPGFLLPYPSSSACPNLNIDANFQINNSILSDGICHVNFPPMKLAPSMSSLEALLSKLPSVNPPPARRHFAAAVEEEFEEEEEEEEEGHGGGQ